MRVVFLRTLGIEYTGVSGLFTDVLLILSFAELGISGAIAYSLYKPIAEKNTARVAALMNFYKSAYRIVAAVVMVGGLCFIPFLGFVVKDVPDIKENIILLYVLYVINSAVSYLFIYKSTLFTANQEHHFVSWIQIAISVIRSVVECILLFFFRNFLVYLIFGILITCLQNVLISIFADKRYPELKTKSREKLSKEDRKYIFKDVRALMIYKICNSLLFGCDSVIISSVIGTGWVGYLSNYTLVTSKISNLTNQFYSSCTPSIGNLAATDNDRQYSTFKVLQFTAFWFTTFCAVSFVVMLNPFVELVFGPQYVCSMVLVIVLSTHYYMTSLIQPVTSFRDANGLFVQGKYRPVFMCIINIGLSIVLALVWGRSDAQWGVIGVKIATIVSQLCTLQWFDPYLIYKNIFKKSLFKYFKKTLLYFTTAAVIAAATWGLGHLIETVFSPGTYVIFAIKLLLCIIVPNVSIFLLFRKTPEFAGFMETLKNIFAKKKAKKAAAKA